MSFHGKSRLIFFNHPISQKINPKSLNPFQSCFRLILREFSILYFTGETLSASNCRRVQSEIMASVSRIKSSILGRKGGFLHTYAMLESNDTGGSVPVSLNTSPGSTTPVKQNKLSNDLHHHSQKPKLKNSRSQGSLKLRSKSPGPILMRDSITVSLPSPAGNR